MSATCLLQALPTDLTAIADNDVHAQVDAMGEEITQLRAQLVGNEKDLQTAPTEGELKVSDEIRPVVPIFKAGWRDYSIDASADGGTCTFAACN